MVKFRQTVFLLVALLVSGCQGDDNTQDSASEPSSELKKMTKATGQFTVSMSPQGEGEQSDGLSYARYTNEKAFTGDLVGSSKGTMLTAMTPIENSAGYVLIEHVSGTLDGRQGSFSLQHSSTVDRGEQHQSIVVVPDSGTGQLEGLTGSMIVDVSSEGHAYIFEYSLPD